MPQSPHPICIVTPSPRGLLRRAHRCAALAALGVTVTCTLPGAAPAAPPPLLRVGDAVRLCLDNNFALSLARDQTAEAAVNRKAGVGPFLPDVSASLDNRGKLDGTASQTSVGASATLEVFDGFQSYFSYRRLQSLELGAQLGERLALEQALEGVLSAYYGLVQQKQNLSAIKDQKVVSYQRAALANAKLEVGAGSRLEQLQSQADFNSDSSAYLTQEIALRQAEVQLNQLLARDPAIEFDVEDTIPLESNLPLDRWIADLATSNTAVLQAESQRATASATLAQARGGYLPSVSAGLNYNDVLNGGQAFGTGNGLTYSLNLTVPIFDRLNTPRAVGAARAELRSGVTRKLQAEESARADFAVARGRYEIGLDQVALEEGNLQVARLQAEAALEQYKIGTTSPLELRDAQQKLLAARVRLFQARLNCKQAELDLKRLAGALVRLTPAAAPAGEGK